MGPLSYSLVRQHAGTLSHCNSFFCSLSLLARLLLIFFLSDTSHLIRPCTQTQHTETCCKGLKNITSFVNFLTTVKKTCIKRIRKLTKIFFLLTSIVCIAKACLYNFSVQWSSKCIYNALMSHTAALGDILNT